MAHGPFEPLMRYLRRAAGPAGVADAASDGELLRRFVAQRDEPAFEMLVERYAAMVLGICRRVLQDHHGSEDAFQATFLVLARKAGSIAKHDSVGSWLHGVAYRIATRARGQAARRRAHEKPETDMLAGRPADNPQTEAQRREFERVLDEELQRLPEKHRGPLVLCYLRGQTQEEAARAMSCPLGSMAWRLEQARECLRQRLSRRGLTLPAATLSAYLTAATASAEPAQAMSAAAVRAACSFLDRSGAAAASPAALDLAKGALRTMLLKKLSVAAVLLAIGVAALGIVASGLLTTVNAVPAEQGAVKPAAIALPKDAKTEIVVLDFSGGLIAPSSIKGPPPLIIRADGSLTVNLGKNTLDAKLSSDELQALLHFIIVENHLFDIDPKNIPEPGVADALTTYIKVKTADKEREVKVYALEFAVQANPKNKQAAELYAVQNRLQRVMLVAQVGGEKVLEDVVKLANRHVKAKFPQAEPLTDADRQSGGLAQDGSRHFKFYRAGKAQGSYVIVEIVLSKEGEPKVTVQGKQ